MTEPERIAILKDHSEGRRGTRQTIAALDMRDYADLIIALVALDLDFPTPTDSTELRARRERAREILLPRLEQGS